jgi:hypothetical protein
MSMSSATENPTTTGETTGETTATAHSYRGFSIDRASTYETAKNSSVSASRRVKRVTFVRHAEGAYGAREREISIDGCRSSCENEKNADIVLNT